MFDSNALRVDSEAKQVNNQEYIINNTKKNNNEG